jgi:hypothetical protein
MRDYGRLETVSGSAKLQAARTHDDGDPQGGRRRVGQTRLAGVKALRWYILMQAG